MSKKCLEKRAARSAAPCRGRRFAGGRSGELTALLVAHAAATLPLAGLAWFVQVVHYPLFAQVGNSTFTVYERAHRQRTTMLVVPLMLVEAGTASALFALDPRAPTLAGLLLAAALYASTAFVKAPCHRALESGRDPVVHRRFVRTNWARAMWSATCRDRALAPLVRARAAAQRSRVAAAARGKAPAAPEGPRAWMTATRRG